eukprot:TRINITY_DN40140_c0_g1_i2.p1 TRINITY_DN40140_c0_g1~~TRINITY_DN40140_c0_g1_i2.p1  ORF type:complete len:391 (+),score=112.26 TRINITY_DN40140_c0_g1_i2:878-2050(+)
MFRVNAEFVRTVLSMAVPDTMHARVVLVLDCGEAALAAAARSELQALEREHPGRLRVRVNPLNEGASCSRSRGLRECHSEWVLFLDDDVQPDPGLLVAYGAAIRQHAKEGACGFIGLSRLPLDGRLWTDAIHWHIAEKLSPDLDDVPWGVTANLVVRWTPALYFDDSFPKTGGGEDIDFCIRVRRRLEGRFVAVPDAQVCHPWRQSAFQMYVRMAEWAAGDGMLNSKHPDLTRTVLPTLPVYLLLFAALQVPAAAAGCAAPQWSTPPLLVVAQLAINACWVNLPQNKPCPQRDIREMPLWRRAAVGLLSGVSHVASDTGRACGMLRRVELPELLTEFDWWAGTQRPATYYDYRGAALLVVVAVLEPLLAALGVVAFALSAACRRCPSPRP